MSVAEKLTTIAQNQQLVYDAGYEAGMYDGGIEVGLLGSILDSSITTLYYDKITKTGTYSLSYRSDLVSAELPNLVSLGNWTFAYCTKLQWVKLQSATQILNYAFSGDRELTTLILGSQTVCSLDSANVFRGTPIESGTGYIYVPDELVDKYKVATNWSAFANQIKPISELEEN